MFKTQSRRTTLAEEGSEDARYFIRLANNRGNNEFLKKILARHQNTNARLNFWKI